MLVEEAQEAQRAGADIIEWRVDMLFGEHPNFSFSQLGSEIIPQLVQATQIPLMLTIRTASQGGAVKVSEGRYRLLLAEMLDTLLQLRVPGDRIVVDISIGIGQLRFGSPCPRAGLYGCYFRSQLALNPRGRHFTDHV